MRDKFKTRSILLRGKSQQEALLNLIVALPFDDENPLEITIAEQNKSRSNEQNKKYWAMINEISEQIFLHGKYFAPEIWAEYFKTEFLPPEYLEGETKKGYVKWVDGVESGKILVGSTTQLTTSGFANYLEKINRYAAQFEVIFYDEQI